MHMLIFRLVRSVSEIFTPLERNMKETVFHFLSLALYAGWKRYAHCTPIRIWFVKTIDFSLSFHSSSHRFQTWNIEAKQNVDKNTWNSVVWPDMALQLRRAIDIPGCALGIALTLFDNQSTQTARHSLTKTSNCNFTRCLPYGMKLVVPGITSALFSHFFHSPSRIMTFKRRLCSRRRVLDNDRQVRYRHPPASWMGAVVMSCSAQPTADTQLVIIRPTKLIIECKTSRYSPRVPICGDACGDACVKQFFHRKAFLSHTPAICRHRVEEGTQSLDSAR